MHRLALTYERLMDLELAEALEWEVLSIRTKILGQTHPDTLSSVTTLARIRETQRKQSFPQAYNDHASTPESVSDATDVPACASSMTSFSDYEQEASFLLEGILTSDSNLISIYVQLASGTRQTRFLQMMAKQLRLLCKDLQAEAPSFLKHQIRIFSGSKRRRRQVLSGIYDKLKLFEPFVKMAKALNEAQSEELSTNTIQWIEHVSNNRPSEPEVWPATEEPEIDAKDIADSESDSDQGDEEVREQSEDGLEQAKTFVARSSSLVSYKNRIKAMINPYLELDVSLTTNNFCLVRDLLYDNFAVIAVGP
ncbi:hypothetical protein LTR81_024305 [Elasticomyces elasticus]